MNSAEMARGRLGIGMPGRAFVELLKRERRSQPMSVQQWNNDQREVEYVARRNGEKEPLLRLWRV